MHANEQAVFDAHASTWWDEKGPFKPLHDMNPLRMEFIVTNIKKHFEIDDLKGLKILDVGCGGGLICEPLARLGADVTGIDLSHEAIEVARDHAQKQGLSITYKHADLSTIKDSSFDVVIASEVIEHVEDPSVFVKEIARALKNNGCTIITTLNRTIKSKILGIYVAENILKWAPKGAHHHENFIKPSELHGFMIESGLTMEKLQGVIFNPLTWSWEFSKDMDINYFCFGSKG